MRVSPTTSNSEESVAAQTLAFSEIDRERSLAPVDPATGTLGITIESTQNELSCRSLQQPPGRQAGSDRDPVLQSLARAAPASHSSFPRPAAPLPCSGPEKSTGVWSQSKSTLIHKHPSTNTHPPRLLRQRYQLSCTSPHLIFLKTRDLVHP